MSIYVYIHVYVCIWLLLVAHIFYWAMLLYRILIVLPLTSFSDIVKIYPSSAMRGHIIGKGVPTDEVVTFLPALRRNSSWLSLMAPSYHHNSRRQ